MAFNIEQLKNAVRTIARPTLFQVTCSGSIIQSLNVPLMQFTCKSAQLPEDTVGKIDVPFYGRKIPFAGDRTYSDWQTTIIMDKDYTLYKQLWSWKQKWNAGNDNVAVSANMNDFKADCNIIAYDAMGLPVLNMKLVGAFPYQVQPLDLSWENTDTTADLNVTWFFDYVERVD